MAPKIWGFIGCGNLAQAIIGGAVNLKTLSPFSLVVTDVDVAKVEKFSKITGVTTASDIGEVVRRADIIVISTKPQDAVSVLEILRELPGSRKTVVSLAAGVSSPLLLKYLSAYDSIIRVMANTPALVQRGLFGIFSIKKKADAEQEVLRVFKSLGEVVLLKKDDEVDVLTSASASGVGFVLSFMEDFESWLRKKGIKAPEARHIAIETFLGTALLAKERTTENLESLINAVTSKKGTTLAGLKAMKKAKVGAGLKSGLEAGYRRAREIAKDLLRGRK